MSVKKSNLTFLNPDFESKIKFLFVKDGVSAGFPSPAADFMEDTIDLNKELSKNPLATFFIKVSGSSMIDAGIDNNDVLVVDRSLEPKNNKIAVCFINGEFTVKRISVKKDEMFLMPENKNYKPIKITSETQIIIWGIVTYVIKSV